MWGHEKIRNLLDSVYNGYPIGSLLLWETHDQLPEEDDLGEFKLPATPKLKPRNYVLDGQQRLVTLFGSLKTPEGGTGDKFPVFFDLRVRTFTHEGGEDNKHCVPMSVVSDVTSVLEYLDVLKALPDSEELSKELKILADRFGSCKLSVVTVHEKDVTKVAPIFERINSSATRLTLFDFMVAALWRKDFNLKTEISDLRDQLESKSFDGVDEVTIIRSLSAVVTNSAKRESMMQELRTRDVKQLRSDIETTRNALSRAVDFLTTDLNVLESGLLPYERQLVLLTYVFSKKKKLTATSRQVLRRWFWRTSLSERYRRGGEGLFDEDLNEALKALEDPDRLKRFGDTPTETSLVTSEFRSASAFTKVTCPPKTVPVVN